MNNLDVLDKMVIYYNIINKHKTLEPYPIKSENWKKVKVVGKYEYQPYRQDIYNLLKKSLLKN